jgi:hypothetical protein
MKSKYCPLNYAAYLSATPSSGKVFADVLKGIEKDIECRENCAWYDEVVQLFSPFYTTLHLFCPVFVTFYCYKE